jgi:hypothetical protein
VVLIPPPHQQEQQHSRPSLVLVLSAFAASFAVIAVLAALAFFSVSGSRSVVLKEVDNVITTLSGKYFLRKVDSSFERYLSSLDVPEFLHGLIMNASEEMEVVDPEEEEGEWTIRRITGNFINSRKIHTVMMHRAMTGQIQFTGESRRVTFSGRQIHNRISRIIIAPFSAKRLSSIHPLNLMNLVIGICIMNTSALYSFLSAA